MFVRPKQTTLDSSLDHAYRGVPGVAVSRAMSLTASLAISIAVITFGMALRPRLIRGPSLAAL
jgi:hypothetical protein